MTFKKAERKQHKPKLALTGPSGSGKTFSSLLLASGMGKKIALIDTENGSASLYADMDKGPLKGVRFDVLEITPPYTIGKYAEAIEAAQSAGYDVLVVDSISHAWAGEGGLLAKKEALDSRGGNQNSYTNWASITKEHEQFKARILNADIILVCTMRSKQDYVLETNEKGKQAPRKVGMAPIQRDGMEYEFTTVFDIAMDHNAAASKDRTAMFDGQIFKITKKTGEQIMNWLRGGKPIELPAAKPAPTAAAAFEEPEQPADGAGESGNETILQIKPEQIEKVKAGIAALVKRSRTEEVIWTGIRKVVLEQHGRKFSELGELTDVEGETVIEYLNKWAAHIDLLGSKPKSGAAARA